MTETSSARTMEDLPVRFNAAVDLLAPNLAMRPDKFAFLDAHGSISFAELAARVDSMAGAFAELGLAPGARVLLCLLDTRDFPIVFLGAIKAGVVPVPLNTLLTSTDYAWILENSGAQAVFVTSDLADKWTEIAAAKSHVRFFSSEGGPWTDLASILHAATPRPAPADTSREDIAFWLYTSGSTGRPKGAMHRHGSMRLTANLYARDTAGYRETDVILSVAKLFFAYGLGNALTFPLAVGATTILHRERASPHVISQLLEKHHVTILGGVPTFFAGWLASEVPPLPHLRVALSAGEALPAHLGKTFRAKFGADILDGLGSTEMLHIFLSQRPGSVRYGCTGKPVDGYTIRIVNDAGVDCATGDVGDLHVSGPTSATAYWQNLEKSIETFQGAWTVTGDKYVMDAEGWCSYAGRGDDMLKVGGIYVSPIEVEAAIASHPDVIEVAVIGALDADSLIKPKAFVVTAPGAVLNENALKLHVKAILAPYKYPRWVSFVDELPKTATGKIQRYKLRDLARAP